MCLQSHFEESVYVDERFSGLLGVDTSDFVLSWSYFFFNLASGIALCWSSLWVSHIALLVSHSILMKAGKMPVGSCLCW